MIKNYIKTAARNLWKSKGYSFINILGLALGMAVSLIIALWINSEIRFDRFYSQTDRLYQVYTRDVFDGNQHTWGGTPHVLGPILQQEHPEIEHVVRTSNINHLIHHDAEPGLSSSGVAVDAAFLKLFDFKILTGNSSNPLSRPDALVLTASTAKKLFGTVDIIGRRVEMDSTVSLTVEAVIEDIPSNSRFYGNDFICSLDYMAKTGKTFTDSWTAYNHETYVLLKEGALLASVNKNIGNLVAKHTNNTTKAAIYLYPASRWHLYNKSINGQMVAGNITTLQLFGLIGILILLIACINFINLSTAGAERRAKEIGLRKVVGASKKSLIQQFLLESFIITFLAGLLALLMILLALPSFNKLINGHLTITDYPIFFYCLFLTTIFFCSLCAGLYPAFVLSAFNPVKSLKGNIVTAKSSLQPRKILVTLQFTISIGLGICTFIIGQQIRLGEHRESGYDRDNLVYVPLEGNLDKNYQAFRNELFQQNIITSMTKSWGRISRSGSNSWGYSWPNDRPEDYDVVFNNMATDVDFTKTMGVKLIQGRDIDIYTYPSDSSALLLNQAAVSKMRLSTPLGTQVTVAKGTEYQRTYQVVGVIADFVWQSPYQDIEPMMIQGPIVPANYLHIRLNTAKSLLANIEAIQSLLKKYNPDYTIDIHFIDEEYALKFAGQKRTMKLTALFSGLAILIACLGLLGLVSFATIQKQKEIGIRKVLGASVFGIIKLLSRDFIKLIGIALLIASPIAWWIMNQWLEDYVYRIDIQWWIFALAGCLATLIALFTVSTLAIKAATANPVDSLRDE
ncbi:ABC transporter permease [Sphingobacterium thalpophilum]|uniref:ABC transporter permease n=1 Tax=Sphingobacterium thalpophilum TaxID=259 RepID=UPI003C712BFA